MPSFRMVMIAFSLRGLRRFVPVDARAVVGQYTATIAYLVPNFSLKDRVHIKNGTVKVCYTPDHGG